MQRSVGLVLSFYLSRIALTAQPAGFDPSRDVSIVFSQGTVVLSAPAGVHFKGRFLGVTLASGSGRLQAGPPLPARDLDEAGDPIYRGEVRLPVSGQGLTGNVVLEVKYQPCTEGAQGVCYLPMVRRLTVKAEAIPAGEAVAAPAASGNLGALEELAGQSFTLAVPQGSAVLVDFWASWCGPCRKSLPGLDRLNTAYAGRGLKVVGIALDQDGGAVDRFLNSVPVGFQIVRDPGGELARRFQVVAMPTTLLLDGTGQVVARFEGGGRLKEEEAAVMALLAGKTLPGGAGSLAPPGARATGKLKAWDRGHLADPILNLDGDPLTRALWEHIHASKEGAAGTGGAAGGGCGCN